MLQILLTADYYYKFEETELKIVNFLQQANETWRLTIPASVNICVGGGLLFHFDLCVEQL